MSSGTLDLFCPCGLAKHLKIIMTPFFLQQQFTLYLHLDVLGAFHVQEDLFANLVLFLPKSITISVTVSLKDILLRDFQTCHLILTSFNKMYLFRSLDAVSTVSVCLHNLSSARSKRRSEHITTV